MIVDYRLVLEKGLVCIQNEAKNLRAQLLPRSSDYFQTTSYYESVVTVCEAVITYAKRFASYAESLFQRETSSERRRELQIIAKNCRRVPAYPAETFWQALQSFWFIHVALQLESNGHSVSAGRFDQYIYPFLERDMQRHRITADFAEELLHCLWLKFNEVNKLRDRLSSVAFAGYPMYQNLILGGITPAGKDAANSLSYLCMQASEKVGLPQPSLSVRWHRAAEDKFLRRACEVSSYGMGLPAFFNDEILIPIMVAQGYSLKEARDYAIVGCVEPTVPGISEPWLTGGFLNLLKILELTINNGFDPIFEKQRAHKTGEIEDLQTFEHFYAAFLQQVSYYVQQQVLCDNILECAHAHLCPTPFQSALTADCLKNAKTTLEGGARYNTTTINIVGFANVVDSFSVIKHLVYEQRMVSWPELKQVLCDNFEEREAFRQLLLNRAPKFGNDNDTVDSLAKDLLSALSAEVDKYSNTRGGRYMVALYSIACHILLANKVGATPDGRKRSMLLADGGVSCVQGRDRQGPTAVVNSVAKLDHRKSPGGALLNLRLSPTLYNGQMGIENVAAMVKAFFLAAGQHVQFNVIDTETLRDAQAHPQNYPMLVVRVAGFSALFNTLSRLAQEDIIQRTEHMSG
jgi:formate C-acetyltransferase